MPAGVPALTLRELNRALLARQFLLKRQKLDVVDAVERLACLQGQWARSPSVALWSRPSAPKAVIFSAEVWPTFLVDGFVAGRWSIGVRPREAVLELKPFKRLARADRASLVEEGEKLVRFYAPESKTHGARG